MQIKLVLLTICASLVTLGFAAPAPDPSPAPFIGPLIRVASKTIPNIQKGAIKNLRKVGK
ncbi:hypothetical protein RMATCC62417_15719 [Rhizopus microsporus]|nr:hypothetical protein RMATCC62417_15719 [Rhizopus microsporus]